jgi:hypothetical protein
MGSSVSRLLHVPRTLCLEERGVRRTGIDALGAERGLPVERPHRPPLNRPRAWTFRAPNPYSRGPIDRREPEP